MFIKPFFAEFIGTSLFALMVLILNEYAGTPGFVGLYVPAGLAVSYALLSTLFRANSGGHLNPAVTLGWIMLKRLKISTGVVYIAAQIGGAFVALLLFRYLSGSTPLSNHAVDARAFIAEFIGAVVLVWAVVAAEYGAITSSFPGIVAGLGLFLAISVAQAFSGGVINPAVALAEGSYALPYLLAPLLGGSVGALLARLFAPTSPLQ